MQHFPKYRDDDDDVSQHHSVSTIHSSIVGETEMIFTLPLKYRAKLLPNLLQLPGYVAMRIHSFMMELPVRYDNSRITVLCHKPFIIHTI